MPETHRLTPGESVDLADIPTTCEAYWEGTKDEARAASKRLRKRLIELQHRFYAAHDASLLIVLQAMDAGGKDGSIRNIFKGVNPQGVRVENFKKPSLRELEHDYLWRVHRVVPRDGHVAIFNRSHYGDVLVVRVENLVPEEDWRKRYDHINDFERLLTDTGTHILKFYLHISKEEQKARLQARLDRPDKNWKFNPADLDSRAKWDAYRDAYETALTRCTTDWAPWYVIPADQKWYRNLAILRVIVDRLEQIDPQFPDDHNFDPSTITID